MEKQPIEEESSMSDNNTGTVGRVVEKEKGNVVVSEHHTPNPTGYAENDEDHRTSFTTHIDEEEPRDTISDQE